MKIDLHCHTKKVKKGDAPTRTVSPSLFLEKIQLANVDLVAITNHNAFDYEQYTEFCKLGVCMIWPGIELDAKASGSSERYHILVICDPAKVSDFRAAVDRIVSVSNPDEFCTDITSIIQAFEPLNAIYIPHYADKKKAITDDNRAILSSTIPNERLFLEPRNLRTLGIRVFSGDNAIIGSDVQDWNSYETCTFAELRLPIASFDQLVLLAKRDTNVITHLLDKKSSERIKVSPAEGVSFVLTFYNDINVIFGEKGTGKSQILTSINDQLLKQGRKPKFYEGSKREENLAALLDKSDMAQASSALGVDNSAGQIKTISSWEEPSPTPLKEYCDWYRTEGFDDAKVKMKIAKMTSLGIPDRKPFEKASEDLDAVNGARQAVAKIDLGKYLTQHDEDELRRILGNLSSAIGKDAKQLLFDVESQNLANFTIESIKALVAGNKGSIPVPATTGFESYACSRIELADAIRTIERRLGAPPCTKRTYLGPLDGKGKVFVDSTWSFWSKNSKKADYPKTGSKVESIASCVRACSKASLQSNYLESLKKLRGSLDELEAKNIDCLVGTRRTIALENGQPYQPSNGEKGILLLRQALDSNAGVYLIDEPELGMGNSFIEDSIRPKLIELSKQNRTVIIATHNANIAVRTLPYCTIYREYAGKGIYRTYSGNPFSDALIDIDDPGNKRNWTETSLRTLEGGREAFGERGYIYDAANH